MLSINSNVLAASIARGVNNINNELKHTSEMIATGKRILSAKDDPAGIGILSAMKAQYSSWNAVERNLGSGKSLLDVASGALKNQNELLIKMKDIATEAASDLISAEQRTALQNTFAEMQEQLDTIVNRATIFGQNLVGTSAANVNIQTGINSGDTKTVNAIQSDAATLGVAAGDIDLTDTTEASAAMAALDAAINTVAANQSIIGAQQVGFDSLMSTAGTAKTNLEGAMSRIEDADIAQLSSKLQLLQAQQQLSIQSLGIVNSLPQFALGLLR